MEIAGLSFRRPGLADYADSAAMWADPATTRHIGGKPSTPEESWARLLRNIGHWAATGYGFWTLRDRDTGRFIGEVGLKQFRRGIDPVLEELPEIGWVLAPGEGGRGLATLAAQAALAWGEAHFAWPLTVCLIDPRNAISLRVAEKCGYQERQRATYHQDPIIVLTRP